MKTKTAKNTAAKTKSTVRKAAVTKSAAKKTPGKKVAKMGIQKTTKKAVKKPTVKKKMNNNVTEMAREHITIASQIASRLKRRYTWVQMEDLYSYALLGLTQSANAYDSSRGVPFPNYASQKGMFWAIDEMRKDGILRRRSSANMPRVLPFSDAINSNTDEGWTPDIQDIKADHAQNLMEVRDLSRTLLKRLEESDRNLLMMYYTEHMTFREIAKILKISESSVCLRHKALIKRLRRSVTTMKVA